MPEGRGSRIDGDFPELRSGAGGSATRSPLTKGDIPELRSWTGGAATRNSPKKPERLRAAADLLDQAAAAGDTAAGRFAEARVDSTPFGI